MGRIHDALNKAEEDRKRKRASKEAQSEPSGAAAALETPPRAYARVEEEPAEAIELASESEVPIPAAPAAKKRATREALTKTTPLDLEIDQPSGGKRKKRGIAAVIARAAKQETVEAIARFGERLLSFHNPADHRSEQFRALRTNLLIMKPQPKVLTVTSAISGEGARMTAANPRGQSG